MQIHANKIQIIGKKASSTASAVAITGLQLWDNRPQSVIQKKQVEAMAEGSPVQRKRNYTGLPDQLKSGIENLSGHSMDDVKVHYNSNRPAQLNAHAFAQGTDIHIASGQEKHLPHEAWHVVQQKQGRVQPTMQMKGKVNVNDDKNLEKEADVMGYKALQRVSAINNVKYQRGRTALGSLGNIAQLIPDKEELYWERLRQQAGPAGGGIGLVLHLINYITNAANAARVGPAIAAAVNAAAPGILTIAQLRAVINAAMAGNMAAPGQYAADTAHNAALTAELRANPFIQSVMNGTVHNAVSGQRNTVPAAGGTIPAPAAGADDRVLETTDLFNRLTNLPAPLPAVAVNPINGPHAAMDANGNMDLGWAAARGNILHEFGHHLENNLAPADFATLHNFLTSRTNPPPMGAAAAPMTGMRDSGYFFEHHPGYAINMPQINAGGLAGRIIPQTPWQHVKRAVSTPFIAASQVAGRAYHATPLRYAGLPVSGIKQQIGKLASVMTGRREPRNWGAKGVENFFVHNANNQKLSYSTAVHRFNTGINDDGTTEYLSTTTEFFNRPSHARELVKVDPLRVALFLYLANRPQYMLVRNAFNLANPPLNLDNLIHTIQ